MWRLLWNSEEWETVALWLQHFLKERNPSFTLQSVGGKWWIVKHKVYILSYHPKHHLLLSLISWLQCQQSAVAERWGPHLHHPLVSLSGWSWPMVLTTAVRRALGGLAGNWVSSERITLRPKDWTMHFFNPDSFAATFQLSFTDF